MFCLGDSAFIQILHFSFQVMKILIPFICLKSSNPLDLSQKNPRAKCQYFTEALAVLEKR
jgi:hypothetical protein